MAPGAKAESRVEVATIILLGLAALATAWAAFQSSLWNGVSVDSYAVADAKKTEAAALREGSLALAQEDRVAMLEYLKAVRTGDISLSNVIRSELMAKRARDALEAWERQPPAAREASPLVPKYGYTVPGLDEASLRVTEADSALALARQASERSDHFNLVAVLFAVTLFLLGVCSTINTPQLRSTVLGLGATIFVATAVWMLTLQIRSPL
jgi:hypothetical protein